MPPRHRHDQAGPGRSSEPQHLLLFAGRNVRDDHTGRQSTPRGVLHESTHRCRDRPYLRRSVPVLLPRFPGAILVALVARPTRGTHRRVLNTTQGGADAPRHPPLPSIVASRRTPPAPSRDASAAPRDDAVTRRRRRPGRCWSAWPDAARGTHPWGRRPSRRGTWPHPRRQPVRSGQSRPRP